MGERKVRYLVRAEAALNIDISRDMQAETSSKTDQ
jgi:hypothetical protein